LREGQMFDLEFISQELNAGLSLFLWD